VSTFRGEDHRGGETHFNHLVRKYVEHFNTERPHEGVGNRPLPDVDTPGPPVSPFPDIGVVRHTRLGVLLKSYGGAA
jgi:putative transposase